jgi:hypothetical protein
MILLLIVDFNLLTEDAALPEGTSNPPHQALATAR